MGQCMGTQAQFPPAITFSGVFPIGGATDTENVPVKEIAPAVGYYTTVLGFGIVKVEEKHAILQRGAVKIGLSVTKQNPEEVSLYFDVVNVEGLWDEYDAKGIAPSPLKTDERDGCTYKVFFAKEPYGVCFCFGEKIVGDENNEAKTNVAVAQ
mmetsp:Transcript_2385/g.5448  ORF Transcript_2385/g.5448 Transcript_2385/m.5448 type:complete len:153 (+) Transcript_2385:848-1306(+)